MDSQCVIRVHYSGNTYNARICGENIKATCTTGEEQAARAVARKYFGADEFARVEIALTGKAVDSWIYSCRRIVA